MRIVRFKAPDGQLFTGCQFNGTTATVIRGDIFSEIQVTNQKVEVKELLPPVNPTAIFCIGLNYRPHAEETGVAFPQFPVLFMKNPGAATGPG